MPRATPNAYALAEIVQRLTSDQRPIVLAEAVSAARDIDDPWARAQVTQRLPPEEALEVARGINHAQTRARALAQIAQRLPLEEALAIARGLDQSDARAQALAQVEQRLSMGQITPYQWTETVRTLAMRGRGACVADFAAILPLIDALGGVAAIRSLCRSIISIGLWWPSLTRTQLQFSWIVLKKSPK